MTTLPEEDRALIAAVAGDRGLSSVQCDALADELIALGFARVSTPPSEDHPVKVSSVYRCVCGAPVVLRRTDDPERDVWVHDTRFTVPAVPVLPTEPEYGEYELEELDESGYFDAPSGPKEEQNNA